MSKQIEQQMTMAASVQDQLAALQLQLGVLGEQMQRLVDEQEQARRRRMVLEDLVADVDPLLPEVTAAVVEQFDLLEQRGYMAFARETAGVLDRIVTSFGAEDVRQLGDQVVLILNTVRAMTQPEIMSLLGGLSGQLQAAERHPERMPDSTVGLLRQLRDPEVRRGLAIALSLLKQVAQPYADPESSDNGR